MFTNLAYRIFTKHTTRQHLGTRGDLDHLVLVANQQDELGILAVMPVGEAMKPRVMGTDAPTFFRLLGNSTEGMGHHLVAEANAHQLFAPRMEISNKTRQPVNPVLVLVDTGFAAGH